MTDVRMAHVGTERGNTSLMTMVRLASPSAQGAVNNSLRENRDELPSLLISYVYLEAFLRKRHCYFYRDWVMDSGAFSAANIGADIDLDKYISVSKKLMEEDAADKPTEIFALDVIGDWRATMKNTEVMWKAGVEAIPTFHVGCPLETLVEMARDYPKIGVGGMIPLHPKDKIRFLDGVFAAVWPKKIHGFACTSERMILRYPFHSVDASSWELGPTKFGVWPSLGRGRLSWRGSSQNLKAQIMHHLDLEKRAKERWSKELRLLEGE